MSSLRRLFSGGGPQPTPVEKALKKLGDGSVTELIVEGLAEADRERLVSALLGNRSLLELSLPNAALGPSGAALLSADALSGSPPLCSLSLDGCAIGNAGCAAVCHALLHNGLLRSLSLARNDISNGASLAELLAGNSALTVLSLDHNMLGTRSGATDIAESLRQNACLTELGLASNQLSEDAATALSVVLFECNETLVAARVQGNPGVPQGVLDSIHSALDKNRGLCKADAARDSLSVLSRSPSQQVGSSPASQLHVASSSPASQTQHVESETALRRELEQLRYDLKASQSHAAALESDVQTLRDQLCDAQASLEGQRAQVRELRGLLLQHERDDDAPLADSEARPPWVPPSVEEIELVTAGGESLGLILDDTDGDTAMVLMRVMSGSAAERSGVARAVGRRLTHVCGEPVHKVDHVAQKCSSAEPGTKYILRFAERGMLDGTLAVLAASQEEARCLRNQVRMLREEAAAKEAAQREAQAASGSTGKRVVVRRRVKRTVSKVSALPAEHGKGSGSEHEDAAPHADLADMEERIRVLRCELAAAEESCMQSEARCVATLADLSEARERARLSDVKESDARAQAALSAQRVEELEARCRELTGRVQAVEQDGRLLRLDLETERGGASEGAAERMRLADEMKAAADAMLAVEADRDALRCELRQVRAERESDARQAAAAEAASADRLAEAERQLAAEKSSGEKLAAKLRAAAQDEAASRADAERHVERLQAEGGELKGKLEDAAAQMKELEADLIDALSKLKEQRRTGEELTSALEHLREADRRNTVEVARLRALREESDAEIAELIARTSEERDRLTARICELEDKVHAHLTTEDAVRRAEVARERWVRVSADTGSSDGGHSRPADWVDSKTVKRCGNCSGKFTLTNRKHHCRRCGMVFCGRCCPLSGLADEKRLCISCNAT